MPSRNRHYGKTKKEVQKAGRVVPTPEKENDASPEVKITRPWTPTTYTAFKALLSARLCAAVWSNISDCDEVFNYWEPAHFMLYSSGFQTWEYSPLYAIRSYAYILLHALPSFVYSALLQSNKVLVFYFTRCLLGFASALCEVYFYRSVCQHFGANIGRLTLVFLIFGSGMFISSTAFLPSSFSMYMIMIAMGSWFVQKLEITVLATATSVLLGWPFSVILSLPAAYDIVVARNNIALFVKWSLISLGLILIPIVLIDSYFFGKFVVAPLNIILYNVFTSHGADLYGTEPFSFYFLNCFLNFNIAFVAAMFSLPCVLLVKYVVLKQKKNHSSPSYVLCLAPLYFWIAVFFCQSHKEERFLFPIYPLLCLAASITLDCVQKIIYHIFVKKKSVHHLDSTNWISLSFCILFTVMSISRTVMTYRGYRAPIETFMELNKISMDESIHPLPPEYPVNVCLGKEWYRFPSSFFLPQNWHLQFLKSEFRGQLPKQFANLPNATWVIPLDMNDQNLEEVSRYVDVRQCDYLVDSDMPSESLYEPLYSKDVELWEVVSTVSFLDTKKSPRLFRAFYIPYFSDYSCAYVDYNLLQSRRMKDRLPKMKRHMPNV